MTPDLIREDSNGLFCPRGLFHIDPWKPVPVAVLTHAHADHAHAGSGRYLCVDSSVGILRKRLGPDVVLDPVQYGETRQIGDTLVSLHPAGHVLGSAQVRVECDGRVWVASGDFKRAPDPTCALFEPIPCDTFITEATFGLPVYRWPRAATVAQEIRAWWLQCRAEGRTALLGCYALGKSQRVLAEMAPFVGDDPIYLHGAVATLVDVYRESGVALPATIRVPDAVTTRGERPVPVGSLVLAPPSALRSPWARKFGDVALGMASGWMALRGNRRRRGIDRGFVLSDHADWDDLVRTAEETGARRVLVTHGDTSSLVRFLCERGIEAAPLRTEYEGEADA